MERIFSSLAGHTLLLEIAFQAQPNRGLRSRACLIPLSPMPSVSLAKPPNSDANLDLQNAPPQPNRVRTMRWPILGAMRFFLALVVAGAHLTLYAAPNSKVVVLQYFSGLAAVLGFLVISGYSIAASFAKQREGFYARRALRILPLYVVMIVLIALLPDINKAFDAPNRGQLVGNLFLLQGFFVAPIPANPVVWTLSVEAFFYLATPLLARLSQRSLMITMCISAAACGGARFLNLPFYEGLLFGSNVLLLGWAWILGFWAYRNAGNGHTLLVAQSIGTCTIAMINPFFLMFLWPVTWTITILAIGYGHLVRYNKRVAQYFSVLGDASYPLYLFHLPVFSLMKVFKLSPSASLYLIIVVVVSILLDQLFDKPFKRLVFAIARPRCRHSQPAVVLPSPLA
jgi:peptidoglycan/LPS O-acetylase OafA/YrhL